MSEVKRYMLIKSDADENNNKFWEAVLHDDDSVFCRWGRVGANGQSKTFYGGQRYIDKKLKEKKKKGYRPVRSTANTTGGTVAVTGPLKVIAKKQIKHSCPVVASLIDFLVKVNAHQITTQSGGKMTVDVNSGNIQLPSGMGVLTSDAIDDARDLLEKINKGKTKSRNKTFKSNVQDYLMLVPQIVPRNRGWIDNVFVSDDDIREQISLLDSLEATIQAISNSPKSKKKKGPQVFDVNLGLVTDKAVEKHINKLYNGTRKRMHSSYNLKPKKIYSVHIKQVADAFEKGKKVGNIKELWHGTSASNLLSILKVGLIIPKRGGTIKICGRNYGNGVYFSDQSTKALNYAYGYWSGRRENTCFMFLADVAMGKQYIPKGHGSCGYRGSVSFPVKGYDSTFAKSGESGVLNNEMIVYNQNQCNLKYLVEFS